jgi:hypothetical protein
MKITGILIVLILTFCCGAVAADPASIPRADLKWLIRNANTPDDYQKLANFFHYRAEVYRAKAQEEMADYATFAGNILITPKFPTRADQDLRLFEYYSAAADKQTKLAAHYDEMLVRSGVKPATRAHSTSIKALTNSLPAEGANSALASSDETGRKQ